MKHVFRRRRLKSVVATLKSGETFRGVLWSHDGTAIVLRNSQQLAPGDGEQIQATAVDGELILFTDNVAFLQRP